MIMECSDREIKCGVTEKCRNTQVDIESRQGVGPKSSTWSSDWSHCLRLGTVHVSPFFSDLEVSLIKGLILLTSFLLDG